MVLELTADEVLRTTKSVRKRLDLHRPVPREVLAECLALAGYAPNGGNLQLYRWVVVDDPELRRQVADRWRQAMEAYGRDPSRPRPPSWETPAGRRMADAVLYLRDHLHEVPVLVIPAMAGRVEDKSSFEQANHWGSVVPAMWSFMLALRGRGLGSAWTTVHLYQEHAMAELLGIPDHYTQAGLLPVAYTVGTEFRPSPRRDVADLLRWNGWARSPAGS